MTTPPLRRKRRPELVERPRDQTAGREAGLCMGCREPYKPQVWEDICRDCVAWIMESPNDWLDALLALRMFDNAS